MKKSLALRIIAAVFILTFASSPGQIKAQQTVEKVILKPVLETEYLLYLPEKYAATHSSISGSMGISFSK